ncbi:MAG: hypothetical protein KKB02_06460 [Alphaproteobacteria bacterium]|nr:hypothetical protein [Alphaproteobacteria bacterium]
MPAAIKLDDLSRKNIGQALFEAETHSVFFRMWHTDEGFYLDLGGTDWTVVDIDTEGWRERPMDSPRFDRSPSMAALPQQICLNTLS